MLASTRLSSWIHHNPTDRETCLPGVAIFTWSRHRMSPNDPSGAAAVSFRTAPPKKKRSETDALIQ